MFNFVPPRIRFSQVCERCGLWYPKKEAECTHCKDLGDPEVAKLKEEYDGYHEGNASMGAKFLIAAGIVALVFLALLAFVR